MNSTFRLGRVLGIRVGVHWSVLIIAGLVAWSLATTTLPDQVPGRSDASYWIVATITAIAFLSSILAHELGHSYVARRNSVDVDDITIWMLGGVARLSGPARTARAELRIALAGPAVSMAIALTATVVALLCAALSADDLAVAAPSWLAVINIALVVFNLIPAAPLDGGRVLSAWLWRRWADEHRAHRAAARVGHWFGTTLVVVGIALFVTGDVGGGVWLAFLGWFLTTTADAERVFADARHALDGVRVVDVMTRDLIVAPRDLRLDDFIDHYVYRWGHTGYPVVDDQGRVEGLLTLRAIGAVPRNRWGHLTVADIAMPLDHVTITTPTSPVDEVIAALHVGTGNRALVFDGDQLVGIVSPRDITRLLGTTSTGRPTVTP
jgi:Zn-dependent protease